MFEEREVLPANLLDALAKLDLDEGIRIHDSTDCITFVNRIAREFCLNICKGSDERWVYVSTTEEAYNMLKKHLKEPFKIWLY